MSKLMAPFQKDQFEGCVPLMYCATVTDKSGETPLNLLPHPPGTR